MLAPRLFIFSGLPASGKTTLAQRLATDLKAVHLRIDTIEQALRDLCDFQVEGEGYRLAYRIAADNLRVGLDVVADSCNPVELTRREWEGVAQTEGAEFVNIEVVCGDSEEHRCRVEGRTNSTPDLKLSTWDYDVRHNTPRLVILDFSDCIRPVRRQSSSRSLRHESLPGR